MAKTLVIAEKPSVGRDYARVLKCREKGEGCLIGDEYIVSWAVGHLIGLQPPEKYDAKYKRWNFEDLPIIPESMKLEIIKGNTKQFQILKKLMNSKEIDRIICGTDSGREGELIFRYIYQMAGCKKPFDRLWVSSMTDEAIKKGFDTIKDGHQYDSLYESAKCRSEADWLVGMNGSRAFSVTYHALLSIGRVQTPTLSMIVKRQKEIDAFVPEDYYEVRLSHPEGLNKPEDPSFESLWFTKKTENNKEVQVTRIDRKETANKLLENALSIGKGIVESCKKTPGKQLPPLLYDLTELQRDANRRYGFSANRTLNIAQSLYENHKLLTYPRTDSRYLSDDMKETVRKTLHAINIPEYHDALMGIKELKFTKRIIDNSKITDHHAIIPTPKKPDLSKLKPDEVKIYKMVCQRLIEVFYPPYEYDSMEIIMRVGEETYVAKGRAVRELGFMALRKSADDKAKGKESSKTKGRSEDKEEPSLPLPELSEGMEVPIQDGTVLSKKTMPPRPFTEATLLTAMEYAGRYIEDEDLKEEMDKLSLGTPATRAAIIERLIAVDYIKRTGKQLIPTEKGKKLIEVVPKELAMPEMTGKWEKSLEKIYLEGMDPKRFMGSIERYVRYIVGEAANKKDVVFEQEQRSYGKQRKYTRKTSGENESSAAKISLGTCPLCQGQIYKNSKAYYCSSWKNGCKFTIWQDGLDRYGQKLTDEMMTELLKGDKLHMNIVLPQTHEKGEADLVLAKDGSLDMQNFKKIDP